MEEIKVAAAAPVEGEIKTGDEGMVQALEKELEGNAKPGEVAAKPGDVAAKPGEVVKTAEEIEADRVAAEEAKNKLLEDPEFDLGLDENQKPLKFTKKQILEMKKNGMLQADYTQKTQEIAAERANLKEVVDIIDYLKKNPSKAERIVKILEEKAEEAKETELDLNKANADIDKLLADLPTDDPYAQALRSMKAVNQQTLKVNQKLQERLDQLEGGRKTEEASKLETEAHQTLTEVMTSKEKALKFTDPEEAAYWKKLTLTYLVNSPKEYAQMDKIQFVEYFNKIADQIHADIVKIGEKHVNRYIKSKSGPGGVPVVGGGALPAAPGNKPITADNLQESLEAELGKLST